MWQNPTQTLLFLFWALHILYHWVLGEGGLHFSGVYVVQNVVVPLVTVKARLSTSQCIFSVGKGPLTQLVFHCTPTNSSVHIIKILHMTNITQVHLVIIC